MLTRLRRRGASEDGSAMLYVLLMLVVVSALITSIAAAAYNAQRKTVIDASGRLAAQAAQAGVDDAVYQANATGAMQSTGSGTSATGSWSWTSSANVGDTSGTLYTVVSTGSAQAPGSKVTRTRKVRALITGLPTSGITSVAGKPTSYRLPPKALFFAGLYGISDVSLGGPFTVDSYDSNASTSSGAGMIASGGTMNFPDANANADELQLWGYDASPFVGRCQGKLCGSGKLYLQRPALDLDSTAAEGFITQGLNACTNAGHPLTGWIASHNNGTFPGATAGGTLCFSSLTFDRDTTIDATNAQPLTIYVSGPITVRAGVYVNMTSSQTPDSARLQIYSLGSEVSLVATNPPGNVLQPTPAATQTGLRVAWSLYAPNATCASNPTSATSAGAVQLYGSMVCQRIANAAAGWAVHYDRGERLLTRQVNSNQVFTVASISDPT